MATVDTTQRLAELRQLMKKFAVDVYSTPMDIPSFGILANVCSS